MMENAKAGKGYRSLLMNVLGDGEWHGFNELYYAMEGNIAPEEASREAERLANPPEDLDLRMRAGKEAITSKTLSGMPVEQQGFRHDRATRKYRWRPDIAGTMGGSKRNSGMEEAKDGARAAFRALLANPGFKEALQALAKSGTLNPAQQFWADFALSGEAATALPYEEEPEETP